MRALKTIVATAVIVFALTTVAMAGVQHFTARDGQSMGAQAQQTQPTYSVTLTAAQLEQLMGVQRDAAAKAGARAERTQQQHVERVRDSTHATAQNATRGDDAHAQTTASSGSQYNGDGTCTPNSYDYDHHNENDGSGDGEHHSGDAGGGCR